MTIFAAHYLEQLKNKVIETAGFKNLTPADCKVISSLVMHKTRHNISETTLKRIYGFALSKFKPSLFTIDVLAKYCNYEGWEDFCKKQDSKFIKTPDNDKDWDMLQKSAGKITSFTIQALRNRSGIPYTQTIRRQFVDRHLSDFMHSERTGTIVCAPAGYGKTIGLCHWVEEKTRKDVLTNSNDIVLFFSSNALMSVLLSGRDINDWMLALLGYSPDRDIQVLLDVKKRQGGKFYLIIDGFDEHMFRNEQFQVTLNQIVDLFSFYQTHDWFKIILTMRSSTWVNNRHEMKNNEKTWHTGFKIDDELCVNVPLFSVDEIKELCYQINPSLQEFVALQIAESFNHPLYFQFYYKQHKDNFLLNNVDHLSIYDLIAVFILNKVYLGQYSAEKMLLMKALVGELDLDNEIYRVDKLKINGLIKQYAHAYQELISIGFIREINDSSTYQYNAYVEFGNNNFLEYSIAKVLLLNNEDRFDNRLIQMFKTDFANSPIKLQVLKWCVIHAIKTGQRGSFELLIDLDLSSKEKAEFIIFLGELLEKECFVNKNAETYTQFFRQDFNEKMFDYFFGLELINASYKKTLTTLLKFELSNHKKILVTAALAVIAVNEFDFKTLEAYIQKLKSFSTADFHAFPVNPLNCLDAMYHYFKYGILKRDSLVELTKLSFNAPEDPENLKKNAANDMIYLLGLYTVFVFNNQRKILRFIKMLKKFYKDDDLGEQTSQYGFFMKIRTADIYFNLEEYDRVNEIYNEILNAYKKSEDRFSPYMKILFHALKVKVLVNSQKESLIINEIKMINTICDESGFKLSKLYVLAMLLKKRDGLAAYPKFQKQIHYDFTRIIRDSGLNTNTFIGDRVLIYR